MYPARLPLLYMTVVAVISLGSTINPKFRGMYKVDEVDSEENTDINLLHRAKRLRLAKLLLKKNGDGSEKDYPLSEVETDAGKLEKANPSRVDKEHSRDDPFLLDHQANSLVKVPAAFSRRCRYGSRRCMFPGKRSEVPNTKGAGYNDFGNNDDAKLDLLLLKELTVK